MAEYGTTETNIGADSTPSLLKNTGYDNSPNLNLSFADSSSLLGSTSEAFGTTPVNPEKRESFTPGITKNKPIMDFLKSPVMNDLIDAYKTNKNFGPLGYLSQAIINEKVPNTSIDLTGSMPKLNWSPTDNLSLNFRPDLKTDSGFSGLNVSGSYKF